MRKQRSNKSQPGVRGALSRQTGSGLQLDVHQSEFIRMNDTIIILTESSVFISI